MRWSLLVPQRTDHKAAGLAAFMVGLMIVVSVAAFHVVASTHMRVDRLVEGPFPAAELILNADRDLYQAHMALGQAEDSADALHRGSFIEVYRENRDQSHQRLAEARALSAGLPGEGAVWHSYDEARRLWQSGADELADRLLAGEEPDAYEEDLIALGIQFEQMRRNIDRLEEEFYKPITGNAALDMHQAFAQTGTILIGTLGLGLLLSVSATFGVVRAIRVHERAAYRVRAEREEEEAERAFESRLIRGLDMVETEPDALALTAGALDEAIPGLTAELLLADSSMAHLELVLNVSPDDHGRHCAVPTPNACPAVRRGTRLQFNDSRRFDVCPYLKDRSDGACSAMCVPFSIMGKTVGVLHTVSEVDRQVGATGLDRLRVIVKCLGDRLGLVRAFADSQRQASTDPLTGLTNRRSVEDVIRSLRLSKRTFCIAYGDIDHFKQLNDKHGHETGDRALRLFSQVARKCVRPQDTVGRWGGEEFVLILPDLELDHAANVVERVRRNLAEQLKGGSVPGFTISFGIADVGVGESFDHRLNAADEALLEAKRSGRDRVVIAAGGAGAGEVGHEEGGAPDGPDQPALTPEAPRKPRNAAA